jgi:hypothetical protein
MESPWLTPKEAADYCKISLSLFNEVRREIPIKVGGTRRRPRFHTDELDVWMSCNFSKEKHKSDELRLRGYPLKVRGKRRKLKPLV